MHSLKLSLAAVMALAPLAAQADLTWYGGFGAGGARIEQDLNLTFTAFESNGTEFVPIVDRGSNPDKFGRVATTSLDKFNGTDLGYRIFGGVMFLPWLGIEAGYVYLGSGTDLGASDDELVLSIPGTSDFCTACRPQTDVLLRIEDDIEGWEAYVVGAWPVNDVITLFAKVGVIDWESELSVKNAFAEQFPASPVDEVPTLIPTTLPTSFEEETDGTDLAGGLGVDFKIIDKFVIRLDGTWYDIERTEQAWMLGFNMVFQY
jgi:opacity protein-like surface antigen